jgi:hypothetical protein
MAVAGPILSMTKEADFLQVFLSIHWNQFLANCYFVTQPVYHKNSVEPKPMDDPLFVSSFILSNSPF